MPDLSPGPFARRFTLPKRRRPLPGPDGTAEDIAAQDIAELEAADRRLPPPDPEPLADPPARLDTAVFRLAALGLALVLVLGLAVVRVLAVGPPSLADLRTQAGVNGWPVLTVGVKDDQPGVAYYDRANDNGTTMAWSGFDIDLAFMIAEDLGFRRDQVKFYAIESEDRARMQATDLKGNRVPVKLVIASYSITPERAAIPGVLFSSPYLSTEQSVLTLKGHAKVSTFQDLAFKRVCSLSASTSANIDPSLNVIVASRNRISECIDDLRQGRVEAVTTDATILAGFKDRYPDEFEHWDLGVAASERYGVNVGENKALATLVDVTLYRSLKDPKDDRWEQAFQHNYQAETAHNSPPVNRGVTPIAIPLQPDVPRPPVRDMPWENALP
jgi:glutamate transport system substrate-binding protein